MQQSKKLQNIILDHYEQDIEDNLDLDNRLSSKEKLHEIAKLKSSAEQKNYVYSPAP